MGTPWLTDPFTNPLFGSLIPLLCSMFIIAAAALLAVQYRRAHLSHGGTGLSVVTTPTGTLWQRYWTWAMIALLFVGAVLSGPLAIAVLCGFLCWQGSQEFALLTGMPGEYRLILAVSGWLTLLAVLVLGASFLPLAPVLAFFTWSLLALRPAGKETEVGKRFTTGLTGLWGYLYLGWLPAHLLALAMGTMPGLVLLVGSGVALSDIGAFCTGKLIGGPRLAPYLSPNKTWGGVLGNVLGAALALLLVGFALPHLQLWQSSILVLIIGLGSLWGDLLESLLKRQCGVKDAGTLLPGFGGLLDRIDSLLIVAPLVYYTTALLKL